MVVMGSRRILGRLNWLLSEQFGLGIRKAARGFRGIPRYCRDLAAFRSQSDVPLYLKPCLQDWSDPAGSTHSEYFWQDLRVARLVFEASPQRHVDIGSRLDGFVAHVASFRNIEVLDVRPLKRHVPGIRFIQIDVADRAAMRQLASREEPSRDCIDSLSCLHAIEHFGLGRYGDPVAPDGYARGLESMFEVLAPGGRLYLATPIGHERVEFNANRVFSPTKLVSALEQIGFQLDWCEVFDPATGNVSKPKGHAELEAIGREWYRLGLFIFTKPASRETDSDDQRRSLPGMGLA
jgi:hypothetical protein